MELLPCLRWGQHRWWLPLDGATANTLAAVLMDASQLADHASRVQHVASIRDLLQRDPAFLIYGLLRSCDGASKRPPDRLGLDRLATWMTARLPVWFQQPDRFLAAPEVSASMRREWQELAAECRQRPVSQWLLTAPRWLQQTGPPAPVGWQAYWPQLQSTAGNSHQDGDAEDLKQADASCPLPRYEPQPLALDRLAGLVLREERTRSHFGTVLHDEKLASLKQFAYGLTHEINNPLANIVTRSEQLKSTEPDDKRKASLQRVVDQAMRAHEMISDVMFYAHPPQPSVEKIDLGSVVSEVVQSYQDTCASLSIRLSVEPAPGIQCQADRAMIHDAVAALLRNSVEAIGTGGQILVDWGERDGKVWVRVSDSGPGLSEESRRHAFDPYYSGREAGRGLGLGLCRVYRVAKLHGGDATLNSAIAGCVARFWFLNR
ncbi:Sensor protein ZraS [Roseimaritima multifibrata]|uniref:histidine kinase n=1 Tax=Roseimaritima multifibrata TaxID=1930274 RepID=A0A517MMU1_9BACT|nr:HAMP domain-containing sensor histidine kinase [Roseimaritima multifibrata]QDS96198.1 Sensor protein ZraS [Roseimaritima multifibrata]